MKNNILLDTNIFLRFLIPEDKKLHLKAKEVIDRVRKSSTKAKVPQIVIFEIHYALVKFYKFEKLKVMEFLETVLTMSYLDVESKEYFKKAVELYKNNNIEFSDCFVLSVALLDDYKLVTLDDKLNKLFRKEKNAG